MKANIAKYVSLAFVKAGDLVKTLSISSETRGTFNPTTGKYPVTAKSLTVEALDYSEERSFGASFKSVADRRYLIQSESQISEGDVVRDGTIDYNVTEVELIQQGGLTFIYIVGVSK